MARRAHRLVVFVCTLALCAGLLSWSASGAEAVEYTPPTTPFTEPSLPGTGESCQGTKTDGWYACNLSAGFYPIFAKRLFWVTEESIKNREKVESLQTKVETLHTDLVTLHNDLASGGTLHSDLKALKEALEVKGGLLVALPAGKESAAPLYVHETQQSLVSKPIAESVDASGEALKGAAYFIAGIVVAGCIGYVIYRQVMPRA